MLSLANFCIIKNDQINGSFKLYLFVYSSLNEYFPYLNYWLSRQFLCADKLPGKSIVEDNDEIYSYVAIISWMQGIGR